MITQAAKRPRCYERISVDKRTYGFMIGLYADLYRRQFREPVSTALDS